MIRVRQACEIDIPGIVAISEGAASPPWSYEYVQERLIRDDTTVLVSPSAGGYGLALLGDADDDFEMPALICITGFAVFRQVGDDGELLLIAVGEEHRRSGIGSALLERVLLLAVKKGLSSVFLEVRQSNAAAIAFYESHGFEQLRVREAYYDNPVEDAVVMSTQV